MDLGAMVCLPRKPLCLVCPLQSHCLAFRQCEPERYPVKSRKLTRKAEAWWLLLLRDPSGRVWLERRPTKGIWAGLYSLPTYLSESALLGHPAVASAFTGGINCTALPAFLHVLTHRDLHLNPVIVDVYAADETSPEAGWYSREQWNVMGLPAPIRKLLDAL